MHGRAIKAIRDAASKDPRVWQVEGDYYDDTMVIFLDGAWSIKDGNDILSSFTASTIGQYKERMAEVFQGE